MAKINTRGPTFFNDGGPLNVLPRELLKNWGGGRGTPVWNDIPADSDYARACEARYPADLLPVGNGFGLVIGAQDAMDAANWLHLSEGAAYLVGNADESEMPFFLDLIRSNNLKWQPFADTFLLSNGELILLHAASAGDEVREVRDGTAFITDAIPIKLEPGEYKVTWSEVGGDPEGDSFGCVICRWLRIPIRNYGDLSKAFCG